MKKCKILLALLAFLIIADSFLFSAGSEHKVTLTLIQICVILFSAKLLGELFENIFKIPAVLGELVAGIIVGPYALGGILTIMGQPLFGLNKAVVNPIEQIPETIWFLAELGVIILLFLAGLETNKEKFFKYFSGSFLVAAFGIILPFYFGALCYSLYSNEPITSISSLFVGAILTATSVGITARVLSDIKKVDTPEGTTILTAAVIDDVLGLIVLSICVVLADIKISGGKVNEANTFIVVIKALLAWVILGGLLLLFAKEISKLLLKFKAPATQFVLAILLGLIAGIIADYFRLAYIVGSYAAGLALSGTEIDKKVQHKVTNFCEFITPIFFATMGMIVNLALFKSAIIFAVLLTIVAMLTKLIGCGLPTYIMKFNLDRMIKVGVGMVPRGEVALIIAAIGLQKGVIDQSLFGISVFITLFTTLIPPIVLVLLYRKDKQD